VFALSWAFGCEEYTDHEFEYESTSRFDKTKNPELKTRESIMDEDGTSGVIVEAVYGVEERVVYEAQMPLESLIVEQVDDLEDLEAEAQVIRESVSAKNKGKQLYKKYVQPNQFAEKPEGHL